MADAQTLDAIIRGAIDCTHLDVRGDDGVHFEALVVRLKKEAVKEPQPEVHIRADSGVRWEPVGRVNMACMRAGILKVGFITEPPAGAGARLN